MLQECIGDRPRSQDWTFAGLHGASKDSAGATSGTSVPFAAASESLPFLTLQRTTPATGTYPRGGAQPRIATTSKSIDFPHRTDSIATYRQQQQQHLENTPSCHPPPQTPVTRPRRWNRSPSASAANGKFSPPYIIQTYPNYL